MSAPDHQPPHITALARERAAARAAAQNVDHHAWAERIKSAIRQTRADQPAAKAERQADAQ